MYQCFTTQNRRLFIINNKYNTIYTSPTSTTVNNSRGQCNQNSYSVILAKIKKLDHNVVFHILCVSIPCKVWSYWLSSSLLRHPPSHFASDTDTVAFAPSHASLEAAAAHKKVTCCWCITKSGPQWLPCASAIFVPAPLKEVRNFLLDRGCLIPVETCLQ